MRIIWGNDKSALELSPPYAGPSGYRKKSDLNFKLTPMACYSFPVRIQASLLFVVPRAGGNTGMESGDE